MLCGRVIVALLMAGLVIARAQQQQQTLWYSRAQLLALSATGAATIVPANIPDEIRRTYRGRRGNGRRARLRRAEARRERRRYKPVLPAIVMGNVRSLANKMDELAALARSQREYRESSVMVFTETWLHRDIPDCNVSVDGFHTVRADRDSTLSGKAKGGGSPC